MNYYDILGVGSNATQDEIRKAYRTLAMQWHPDRWVDGTKEEQAQAEEVFKVISEVYSVLGDQSKREEYDYELAMAAYGDPAPSWSYATEETPQKEHSISLLEFWLLYIMSMALVFLTVGFDIPTIVIVIVQILYGLILAAAWRQVKRLWRTVMRRYR